MEPFDIRTNQEFSTIPEFPSWTIPVAGFSVALVLSIIYRTRVQGKKNEEK